MISLGLGDDPRDQVSHRRDVVVRPMAVPTVQMPASTSPLVEHALAAYTGDQVLMSPNCPPR